MYINFQVFGYLSSEPLSYEDMYIIGDTAMKNSHYGLAAQWFDESTKSSDPDFPMADVYLKLARALKEVSFQILCVNEENM